MIISYSFDKMSWVNKLFIVLLCTLNNLASHRFRYHQRVCCFWSRDQEQTPVMRPRLIIWLTFQMTDHRARYGEAWESPEDGEICFLGNMTSFVVWSFGYGMTFCSCYNVRCSNVMSRFLSVLSPPCLLLPDRTRSGSAWSVHHHTTEFSPCILKALCFVLNGSKDVIVSHKTCLNSSSNLVHARVSFSRSSSLCCTGRERQTLFDQALAFISVSFTACWGFVFCVFTFNTPSVVSWVFWRRPLKCITN